MNNSLTLRILIVDDEQLIRWSIAETLKSAGCLVSEASSAKETVEQLTQQPAPDVILLDYRLPDVNGLDLLRTIKRTVPASQIVIITAYATDDMAFEAMKLGAYRVVQKPIEMSDVVALARAAYNSRPS